MPDLTLNNTRSLLEEIEHRMGDDWRWEITADEVDKLGYERHGEKWDLARDPDAIDWSGFRNAPVFAGAVSEFYSRAWDRLSQGLSVELVTDELHQTKLDESKSVRLAVRRELRNGMLVAVRRKPDGFSDPIESTQWDGTLADDWILTGRHDGHEIRVCPSSKSDNTTIGVAEPLRQELRRMLQMSSKPDGLKAKSIQAMIELVGNEIALTEDGRLIGPRSKAVVKKISDHSGLGGQLQPDNGSYKTIVSHLSEKGLVKPR
ncbi:MAG: hypothetical protein ABJC59_21205 [Anderseniella sp.]